MDISCSLGIPQRAVGNLRLAFERQQACNGGIAFSQGLQRKYPVAAALAQPFGATAMPDHPAGGRRHPAITTGERHRILYPGRAFRQDRSGARTI